MPFFKMLRKITVFMHHFFVWFIFLRFVVFAVVVCLPVVLVVIGFYLN